MKALNRVIAMAMLAVAVFIGNVDAATNTVYSTVQTVNNVEMTPEQQLVYAVTNAAAGDVVLIKPGRYTFTGAVYSSTEQGTGSKIVTNLLASAKSISIIGDTDLSRRDWNDGDEPVIIDANGKGRLFRFNASNCSVRNLTVTGCTSCGEDTNGGFICMGGWNAYPAFTNCVFRNTSGNLYAFHVNVYESRLYDCAYTNNTACLFGSHGVYACDFIGNSGYFLKMNAYGCRFEANSSSWFLNISAASVLSNCSFVANTAQGDGMIRLSAAAQIIDCTFDKNTNTLIKATLNESGSDSVVVSGCTFSSNVITSVANSITRRNLTFRLLIKNETSNFTSASAAQSRFIVKDSTFEGSKFADSTSRGLFEVFGVTATGCTFGEFNSSFPSGLTPPDYNIYATSACNSLLECCDISGGDLVDCVVDRCTLHDVGSPAYACFRDYCRVTNTLVANCSARLYMAITALGGGRHDAEFVNCTFAGNNALTYESRYNGDSTNDVKFVNCLFNSNTNGKGTETDFSMANDNGTLDCWTSKVSFDHCFYGMFTKSDKLTDAVFAAKTNGVDTLSLCANPKFVQDSRPETPYWSLLPNSSLIGKGDASIWTAEDVDLVGKLRLKDGKVDPGCYQCWINPPGMAIFVR